MIVTRVEKGDKVGMPLSSFQKGSGVTTMEAPRRGILVQLSPEDAHSGVIFITETELNKVGYSDERNWGISEEVAEGKHEEG